MNDGNAYTNPNAPTRQAFSRFNRSPRDELVSPRRPPLHAVMDLRFLCCLLLIVPFYF
jgi:hypothetical protein